MIRGSYVFWLALFFTAVPVAADQQHNHDKAPVTAAAPPPLFKNLGMLHHPVTTSSPQAQQYFDHGLRLIYAFNHDEAARSFTEAARLDPNCAMVYWGIAHAVLLTADRPVEAEAVYHEDLKRNPENGWSLYGLTQSLKAQKKAGDAAVAEKRFRKAWARADVKLSASRF